MRNKNKKEQKESSAKKAIQITSTVLLIICTLLCFYVVAGSAFNQDASLFGFRLFYVVSGSMEPDYPIGSMLVVGESDTYEVNDVITFYSREESIKGYPNTHRIIEIKEENGNISYITKGDANSIQDDIPVLPEDIIGKVYFCINTSFFKDAAEILGTPTGFFVVILLPILFVAVICMKNFKKAITEEMKRAALESIESEQAEKKEASEDETKGNGTTE